MSRYDHILERRLPEERVELTLPDLATGYLQKGEWVTYSAKNGHLISGIVEQVYFTAMNLTENTGRTCRLNGLLVATDFDITPESLAVFEDEILTKTQPLLERMAQGEFDKVEVGIYGGEVRAWGVTGG